MGARPPQCLPSSFDCLAHLTTERAKRMSLHGLSSDTAKLQEEEEEEAGDAKPVVQKVKHLRPLVSPIPPGFARTSERAELQPTRRQPAC
jgi:hypothetical protein